MAETTSAMGGRLALPRGLRAGSGFGLACRRGHAQARAARLRVRHGALRVGRGDRRDDGRTRGDRRRRGGIKVVPAWRWLLDWFAAPFISTCWSRNAWGKQRCDASSLVLTVKTLVIVDSRGLVNGNTRNPRRLGLAGASFDQAFIFASARPLHALTVHACFAAALSLACADIETMADYLERLVNDLREALGGKQ